MRSDSSLQRTTRLRDATVVVTGASRGLGRDLAVEFARRGSHVIALARDQQNLEKVSAETGGPWLVADLTDITAIQGVVEQIERRWGPIDVLVNNAASSWLAPHRDYTAAQLANLIAVNLTAPAEFARVLIPRMEESCGGHLVNIASLGGVIAIPGLAAYGASKAGLTHLTAVLREELRQSPVQLTLVQLGAIEGTDMYDEVMRSPSVARLVHRARLLGVHMAQPPATVAASIVDAVETGRQEIVIPAAATGMHRLRQLPVALGHALLGPPAGGAPRTAADPTQRSEP